MMKVLNRLFQNMRKSEVTHISVCTGRKQTDATEHLPASNWIFPYLESRARAAQFKKYPQALSGYSSDHQYTLVTCLSCELVCHRALPCRSQEGSCVNKQLTVSKLRTHFHVDAHFMSCYSALFYCPPWFCSLVCWPLLRDA